MPGAGATFAAFRPGVLRVETAIALCFGLGYTVVALTATVLSVTDVIGRTSFATSLAIVSVALWAAAFRWHSPAAHMRALAVDARLSRWTLAPGLAGLAAFAFEKLRIEPVSFMRSEAAWRYWADGQEILRAGGVPGSTLQWGIHIPTTVSKVVLNSFEAGVISLAPHGSLLTMTAVVWIGGVGLFAALLALGRAVGLRALAVGVPALVLAVPVSAPINSELTTDASVYRVETFGRMVAVCAVVVMLEIVRGRMGVREAAVAGVLMGTAAGTHLIPVAVFSIFLAWYVGVTVAVHRDRRRRFVRIARAAAVAALVTVAIWAAALGASGGDLGFQRARGSGGYPGFPVTLDPTKSFEVIKRTHPKGRRTGWAIPPARVGEVALASVFEDLQVTTPRRDYAGLLLLALGSGLVVWLRWRSLGPLVVASWATALTLTAIGLYFSHRYRTFVPATFGPRRLFEYGILFAAIAGVAALSTVLRSAVARATPGRRRGVRRAVGVGAALAAVLLAAVTAPPGVTAEERAGLRVMATVTRTVPCAARILVNVRTAGSFEVLARRISVDEGMAPYLRPTVLRRVLPIVLGAHRFFRDPAANRAFIENQHVDVVVATARTARVGGRPVLKRRRGALRDVPWLRPLVETRDVSIYATPSFAEGAKSCYKST
jgi:hypothetical protein